MKTLQTKAIVLKKSRFSEGDAVATLFTENHGKVRFLAKNLYFYRNRYHGKLESPACVQITYMGKGNRDLLFLDSCEILDPFRGIGEDLRRIFTAFYFIELTDAWIKDHDAHPEVFHLLHASLSLLEKMDSLETLIRVFELRLLALTGYAPKLGECLGCGKPPHGSSYFNFERGGVLCSSCGVDRSAGPRVSLGALNFAQKGAVIHYPSIGRLKIPQGLAGEIETLSHRFLVSRLGKELKSYRFLKMV